MSKEAKRNVDGLTPYTRGAAVTKSDTTVLEITQALYIGGAGAVTVTMADGGDVTFTAVPVGTILPIQVSKVLAATAATAIVALYN